MARDSWIVLRKLNAMEVYFVKWKEDIGVFRPGISGRKRKNKSYYGSSQIWFEDTYFWVFSTLLATSIVKKYDIFPTSTCLVLESIIVIQ